MFVAAYLTGQRADDQPLINDGLGIVRQGAADVLAINGDDRLLPLLSAAAEEGVPVMLIAHACQADGPCLPLAANAMPASDFVRTITRAERYRRSRSAA